MSAAVTAIAVTVPFKSNKTNDGVRTASIASLHLALTENRRHRTSNSGPV
jgi:hypothetical protein